MIEGFRTERENNRRVLMIAPKDNNLTWDRRRLRDSIHRLTPLFNHAGYEIIKTSKPCEFDYSNPWALGVDLGPHPKDTAATNRWLSRETSIKMPKKYSFATLLSSNEHIMAKANGKHRGRNKYPLETSRQKELFIISTLFLEEVKNYIIKTANGDIQLRKGFDAFLEDKLALLRSGKIDWTKNTVQEKDNIWTLERKIVTPSEYYTTYRVLVDGYGNHYYTALIISPHKKGGQKQIYKLPLSSSQFKTPSLGDLLTLTRFRNPPNELALVHILFTHPSSPFYLAAEEIVSYGNNSEEIILSGESADDPLLRQILGCHGINPDHAVPPQGVVLMAKKLGAVNRINFPITGVDIIQDIATGLYFLEANYHEPGIAPSGLDVDNQTLYDQCEEILIERMISQGPNKN